MVSGRSGLEPDCFSTCRRGARNGPRKRHGVACEHPRLLPGGPEVCLVCPGEWGGQVRLRVGLEPGGACDGHDGWPGRRPVCRAGVPLPFCLTPVCV